MIKVGNSRGCYAGFVVHTETHDDLPIVKMAVSGDAAAREAIVNLVHPLIQIQAQTKIFCIRLCQKQYFFTQCTLFPDYAARANDATLCDWGNHSYTWELEDLCSPEHLSQFKGEYGTRLTTCFFAVINSLFIHERWKNIRFCRRIRVPSFIKAIGPIAEKCFFWLHDGNSPETIAPKAGMTIEKIKEILDRIIDVLTTRCRLYLLNKETAVSLTSNDQDEVEREDTQNDIPDNSRDPGNKQIRNKVYRGWEQLTP